MCELTDTPILPHDLAMYRAVNDWIATLPSWSRHWVSLGVILAIGFTFLMALYFASSIVIYGLDDTF